MWQGKLTPRVTQPYHGVSTHTHQSLVGGRSQELLLTTARKWEVGNTAGTPNPCLKCVMETTGLNFETEAICFHRLLYPHEASCWPSWWLRNSYEFVCSRIRDLLKAPFTVALAAKILQCTECVVTQRK